jgi:excisionase family DNA binding protein
VKKSNKYIFVWCVLKIVDAAQMSQIYTVKETAKILGFSTNTVYKYLNEGRIRAARGDVEQGRFRIPHQSIEEFLHTRLPIDVLEHIEANEPEPDQQTITNETTAENFLSTVTSPTSLPVMVSRVIILFCLLGIITDIIMSPTISLLGQIIRIGLVGAFILLSYQNVGSKQFVDQTQVSQ